MMSSTVHSAFPIVYLTQSFVIIAKDQPIHHGLVRMVRVSKRRKMDYKSLTYPSGLFHLLGKSASVT